MPSLGHILERSQTLSASQREWLHQLVGDWQLLSDFSFADLVLVTPLQDERFIIAAACRPATNATALDNDVVNMTFDPADSEKFREIIATGQRGTV
ncbi:histidine kinase N-terminal domain-containing protein, partial [Actinotignum timonense]